MHKKEIAKAFSIILVTVLLVSLAPTVSSASNSAKSTDPMANPFTGVLVAELKSAPLADYGPAQPQGGGRLNPNSPASQNYLQKLSNEQSQLLSYIQSNNLNVKVVYQFSILMNGFALRLNNVVPDTLLNSGVVSSVYPANGGYQTDMDVSPSVVGLSTLDLTTDLGLWAQLGGHQNAGLGMKIGIIDTGISTTNPFLTDNSLPALPGFPKCDALDSATNTPNQNCINVSNKIIVAKVFQSAYGTSFTAFPAQDHGSHVSGIAAGVFNTTAPLSTHPLSGIAPKAYLGNYNVFPGNITNAFDVDIIAALEAALQDGMDVVNMSLGGTATARDPLVRAVDRAANAGLISVIAAGNAGSGLFTIESPGNAMKAITVGATTDPHFFGVPVTVGTSTFGGAVGSFANFPASITATYVASNPSNGCTSFTNAASVAGNIALIARGTCTFSTKIRNAQTAGAIGVIVFDNTVFEDPIAMGTDGTPNQPTIPAVMVSRANGLAMDSTGTVSIAGTNVQEFLTTNGDFMASFSSRGPTPVPPQPFAIKPDVVAPGVNVLSSVPGGFAVFQGTSMATPHVTGAAALLKQLHPDWKVAQVKSALVNSAARPAHLSTSGTFTTSSVLARGGGRIDLGAAGLVTATLDPVSITFGSLAGTPGQTITKSVDITDVSGSTITYSLSTGPVQVIVTTSAADGATGQISLSLSTTSITLGPGGEATFTITLNSVSGTTPNFYQSDIIISGGAVTLKIPLFVYISSP